MSDFPKKIWIDHTILDEFDTELCPESDIAYIRADIVAELREALEKLARLGNGNNYGNSLGNEIARAALKKLEDV